jgi:hypothetical protein
MGPTVRNIIHNSIIHPLMPFMEILAKTPAKFVAIFVWRWHEGSRDELRELRSGMRKNQGSHLYNSQRFRLTCSTRFLYSGTVESTRLHSLATANLASASASQRARLVEVEAVPPRGSSPRCEPCALRFHHSQRVPLWGCFAQSLAVQLTRTAKRTR